MWEPALALLFSMSALALRANEISSLKKRTAYRPILLAALQCRSSRLQQCHHCLREEGLGTGVFS